MANPQPTDAHLRISHAISEELMMRDFTKRQRSILDFILRLSWGCGKKQAIIPKMQDFEICGVARTKIKDELNYLVNARVIEWEKEMNLFSFSKNYDTWKISIVPNYNKERLTELVHINLKTKVPKMGIELPKQEESSHLDGNKVPKTPELLEGSNPLVPTADEMPKESIIESIKVSGIETPPIYDENLKRISKAYSENGFGMIYPNAGQAFLDLAEQYTIQWVELAMKKAGELNKRNVRYVEGILKGWKADGQPNMGDKPKQEESKGFTPRISDYDAELIARVKARQGLQDGQI